MKNVVTGNGVVTELYRREWDVGTPEIAQVFQRTLVFGAIAAWHAHALTTDRLFVVEGQVRLVLYDPRPDSPTHGQVDEFDLSWCRPVLVVVPPRVWHGVQNRGSGDGRIINIVDHAYDYSEPDHWRLPCDTARIPYRF